MFPYFHSRLHRNLYGQLLLRDFGRLLVLLSFSDRPNNVEWSPLNLCIDDSKKGMRKRSRKWRRIHIEMNCSGFSIRKYLYMIDTSKQRINLYNGHSSTADAMYNHFRTSQWTPLCSRHLCTTDKSVQRTPAQQTSLHNGQICTTDTSKNGFIHLQIKLNRYFLKSDFSVKRTSFLRLHKGQSAINSTIIHCKIETFLLMGTALVPKNITQLNLLRSSCHRESKGFLRKSGTKWLCVLALKKITIDKSDQKLIPLMGKWEILTKF